MPDAPYDRWLPGVLPDVAGAGHPDEVWLNSRYQVLVYRNRTSEGFPAVHWLSIKRRDKESIHDWRDFQRIKNDLIGPEHEAVELFPAESRLVDTSNQYHLWVLKDPTIRFPFGFDEGRFVTEVAGRYRDIGESKQRPFELKPTDLKSQEELDALVQKHQDQEIKRGVEELREYRKRKRRGGRDA